MPRTSKSEKVPRPLQPAFEAIAAVTDGFCKQHLNEEYAQLARRATAALCRKRPSPLLTGRADVWACGIVHAVGFVNFLGDSSQELHMRTADLCREFGVGESTCAGKSKIVRNALRMTRLDPEWCLPSKMGDNPLVWMLSVNGLPVDVRWMPLEVQEIAYERGLIPYIPGEG